MAEMANEEMLDRISDQKVADGRDAARYRWLRSRDLDTINKGGVFAGIMPQKLVLNGQHLDLAIDTEMKR